MLTPQLFTDLRAIVTFFFDNIMHPTWQLYTRTILAFVIVAWVMAHIIKFFKRFI